MGLLSYPKEILTEIGSGIGIFLNKRHLKKKPHALARWILLAKLHAVRGDTMGAVRTLELAQKVFPQSQLVQKNLDRLRRGEPITG